MSCLDILDHLFLLFPFPVVVLMWFVALLFLFMHLYSSHNSPLFSLFVFRAISNGTSMISLIVPPKDQISRVSKMLGDEFGTASNIKSRVNRLSVLGAITSVQQRLKLYNKVPKNGLVLYCGTIMTAENKEKKVSIDFEPFKPINTSLYLCDNKFHTEVLCL